MADGILEFSVLGLRC